MQITLPSFDLSVPDEFVAKFPYSIPYQGSYILALLWVVKFPFPLSPPPNMSLKRMRATLSEWSVRPSVRPPVKAAHNLGGAIVDLVKLLLVFRPNFWGRSHCHLLSSLGAEREVGEGGKEVRRSHRNPPTELVFAVRWLRRQNESLAV